MRELKKLIYRVGLPAFLLTAGSTASANQFLVFNTAAYHFKNTDERRTLTPGIGWEYSPSSKAGFHVGTLSDSFGYQATYAGVNWATRHYDWKVTDVRLIFGATLVHKQFHKNSEPETKVLPFPAMEVSLTRNAVLNISGSPELDYAGQKNNAVVFFQLKWSTR